MKKTILVVAVSALLLASCGKSKREIELENKLDSIQSLVDVKDQTMGLLASTMAGIQENLSAIKEREKIVATAVNSGEQTTKEQIENDIQAINDLLQQNKKKVEDLTAQLRKATKKNSEFESIIKVLEEQIAQQNEEIQKLQAILTDKDVEIGFLNNAVIKLSTAVDSTKTVANQALENVAQLTDEKNTAYYVVGSRSELRSKGITESSGLFSKKVSGDADEALFTKINLTEVTEIPTNCKRIKIITTHDENSYTEKKDAAGIITIVIKDKAKFWSKSKYLVIQGREQDED
ncbi:MAG: hypothetical protein HUJ96_00400 [Marinilabiliaceae bacterium]|nr:hypothetical protein [Marinilabiliaceae bacterium]